MQEKKISETITPDATGRRPNFFFALFESLLEMCEKEVAWGACKKDSAIVSDELDYLQRLLYVDAQAP